MCNVGYSVSDNLAMPQINKGISFERNYGAAPVHGEVTHKHLDLSIQMIRLFGHSLRQKIKLTFSDCYWYQRTLFILLIIYTSETLCFHQQRSPTVLHRYTTHNNLIRSDEGITLEKSPFHFFTMVKLPYQLHWSDFQILCSKSHLSIFFLRWSNYLINSVDKSKSSSMPCWLSSLVM